MGKKILINLNELYNLYINEGKTTKEIATQLNCSISTINRQLKSLGLRNERINNPPKELAEYKQKLKMLYLQGLSFTEIAKKLHKSPKTITYHLHKLNIPIRGYKRVNYEEFIKLWNEGKTDEEIASYFKVSVLTIKSYRTKGPNAGKFNLKRYFGQTNPVLSYIQKQMILGSLLGDMSLCLQTSNRNKNARLTLEHCLKQKDYFFEKVKILGEFMGAYKLVSPLDSRTNRHYAQYRGNSKSCFEFTKLYNLTYPNQNKKVTQNWLDQISNPIALAYWFMDDGTSNGCIATDSFSLEEDKLLQKWLFKKWNIITTLQKTKSGYRLHISSKSREQFDNLISPYIIPSMQYKLKYK